MNKMSVFCFQEPLVLYYQADDLITFKILLYKQKVKQFPFRIYTVTKCTKMVHTVLNMAQILM
jgi:hypothetical protein